MSDPARDLFDSLTSSQSVQALVGQAEHLHLEVKEFHSFDDRIKGYMSQALSGFANSDGGVFILGLSTKPAKGEPDQITRVKPFPDYDRVKSDMLHLVGQAVMPRVDDVLVDAVAGSRPGLGYVKMLVPASDFGPHRAMLKPVGDREYWKRSGGGFYRMEHFDIADMFGRRRRPILRLDWRAARGNVRDQMHDWHLVLTLANEGRGLARFPMLEVELPRELGIYEYGLDGNRNHGLRWQPVDQPRGRHRFVGGIADVVHPGVGLDVTKVAGLRLHAHPDAPWEYKPEEIRIPYLVVAEDALVRESVLSFRVEDELARVKNGVCLP